LDSGVELEEHAAGTFVVLAKGTPDCIEAYERIVDGVFAPDIIDISSVLVSCDTLV
jgi:hypothetical protein